jgi:hypothetical protein
VTAVTPLANASNLAVDANVTATFSEAIDPATIGANTFELRDAGNNLVAAVVSYDAASRTATLNPDAALANSTTYTAIVRGGAVDPRVKDVAGNALASNYTWSFTTAAPPSTTGTLQGTVIDSSTSTAISGATVSIAGGGSTTTNASGFYQFLNVAPGSYSLTASKTGYNANTLNGVSVVAGATTTQNIALTSIPVDILYVSSNSGGTAGGITFADEDILAFNTSTSTWSMFFDGSDVGMGNTDIDAFDILDDGSILLSFDSSTFSVPGIGTVEDRDIIRFIPTSTGANTAGTFQWYFDGSDVGLTQSAEDIDSINLLSDGRLVIGTNGAFGVTGVSGQDEDLIVFNPTSLGSTTAGTWAMYFDGSDVGLDTAASEDISGVWVDPANSDIYLSTLGTFAVTGASGDGADVFICRPSSLGNTTACTFGPGLYWDGSLNGFAGEVVDGLVIVR